MSDDSELVLDPTVDDPTGARDPWRWIWPAVLIAAVLVTFGPCLEFGFLSWDDDLHVTANDRFQPLTLSSWRSFWREPYEFLYIPLSYTLFAGEVALSQLIYGANEPLNAGLFHAVSIALHIGNALLVFALLRRWDHDSAAACAGSLCFALHPLQVESVAWISEQRGLLSGMLSLIALWFYCRGSSPRRRDYLFATIGFALALLAKPSAVAVPLMAAAIDYGLLRRHWLSSLWRLLPWLTLSGLFMTLTRAEQWSAHIEFVPSWGMRWWVAADAVGWYVAKLFWPFQFGFDPGRSASHVTELGLTDYTVLSTMPFLLAALAIAVRQRPLAASVYISLAGLLPVLGFVPFVFQNISTVADRYGYLPMLGVGLTVSHVLARSIAWVRWGPALVALLAAAWLSFQQTATWRDSLTLYNHGLTINPRSWTAHHALGNLYYRSGNVESAREHFDHALAIKPTHVRTLNNLAVIEIDLGNFDVAESLLQRAIQTAPWYSEAHTNLANVWWQRGQAAEAVSAYRRAIAEQPRIVDARVNLARSLLELHQLAEAREQIETALAQRPNDAIAQLVAARILAAQQRSSDARLASERALQLDPRLAAAHELLGNLAFLEMNWKSAIEHYTTALALNARLFEASYNLAFALLEIGRHDEALRQLERALALAPANSPTADTIRRKLDEQRRRR